VKRLDLSNYKRLILEVLARAQCPMDVEKIRVACHIGNWQTALKHCLELQYEHKIKAMKSSKGWIFWIPTRHKISHQRRHHAQ
jgi:hypothetical protein